MSALHEQPGGDHYRALPIQPIQYIYANGLSFIQGNLVKYATRAGTKGGREGAISDLLKVIHYARLQLELAYDLRTAPYTVPQPEQAQSPQSGIYSALVTARYVYQGDVWASQALDYLAALLAQQED